MRITIVFSTLLLMTMFAKGQAVHLELHGGYNSVWILNQNNYEMSELNYSFRVGPTLGGALGVDYGPHWGLQMEVNWTLMGQDYEDRTGLPLIYGINDVYEIIKEVDLNYVQVPVLVRYRPGENPQRFLAMLGPQISVLGKSAIRYQVEGSPVDFNVIPGQLYAEAAGPDDFYKSVDIGLAGGVGFEVPMGALLFFRPMLRFYLGLTDINNDFTTRAPDYRGSKNAYLGLHLGFGIKHESQKSDEPRTPGR